MCFDSKELEKQGCIRPAGIDKVFLGYTWGNLRDKQCLTEEGYRHLNGLSKVYLVATSTSGLPLPFSCELIIKSGNQWTELIRTERRIGRVWRKGEVKG